MIHLCPAQEGYHLWSVCCLLPPLVVAASSPWTWDLKPDGLEQLQLSC